MPRSSSRATRWPAILITGDQPASAASSSASSSRACRSARPVHHFSLLSIGDGLARADPRAADLGRHRHHRHALGRLRDDLGSQVVQPDPRPAQGAARRRRRDLLLRARSRACRRSRSWSSAASSSPSAGRCATSRDRAEQRRPIDDRRGRRRRPPAPLLAPRDAGRWTRSPLDPLELCDRLRPGPAGRRQRRRLAAAARRRRPPPDRGRGRHGHPVGPHPRRRRPADSTSTSARCAAPKSRAASIMAGHQLALDPGDAFGSLDGIPTTGPGLRHGRGLDHRRPAAPRPRRSGTPWSTPSRVVVTHLTETIRAPHRRPAHPPGRAHAARQPQGAQRRRRRRGRPRPALGRRAAARPAGALARGRLDPRPRRDRRGHRRPARVTRDPELLAEYARQALGRTIVSPYLDAERTLRAITLDPHLEQEVLETHRPDARRRVPGDGSHLARRLWCTSCRTMSSRPSRAAGGRC